ncbi:hypothetical protein BDF21DRAFT_408015 [Thamnidium elegans]|nr:hypothetical protein BDF21DRAFT_408015 [Thamnidium elegans]
MVDMDNIEICYSDDPNEPMLLCELNINCNPIKYKTYVSKDVLSSQTEHEEIHEDKILLTNEQHIVQFLNTCFLPYNPNGDEVYEEKSLATGDIFWLILGTPLFTLTVE